MANASNMRVDGKRPLTQFVGTLLRQRDLLIEAIKRDDEALRVLESPALPEAIASVERRYWARNAGRRARKAWTWRDEKRLNQRRGFVSGYIPACRVARLVDRYRPSNGFSLFKLQFQDAVAESRRDGTASKLSGLLEAASLAHSKLLGAASSLAQDETDQGEFDDAVLVLNQAVSALLPWAKRADNGSGRLMNDGPCGQCQWRHNGEVLAGTMQVGAWKMVKHLWEQPDRVASFDELIVPIYGDAEHIADEVAFGAMRREANKFFKANGISWRASLKKATVFLVAAE